MRVSWLDFEEYAEEFLCEHCDRGEKPDRDNDECIERCLKDWINFSQKDDGM